MKKFSIIVALLLVVMLAFCACGKKADAPAADAPAADAPAADEPAADEPAADEPAADAVYKAAMVTDVGGVNDQGFNQGAWNGLQKCEAEGWAAVKYLESKQEADYSTNLDTLSDEGNDIIWGIGFLMADAMMNAATVNPDNLYAIVDNAYETVPDNMVCLVFDSQDCSFLVGYIAGKMTETNNVGIVGGVKGAIIDTFEFGYRAGVAYAAKELGKEIEVQVQYADSFTDAAKGKAIATSMFQNGADIVFQAAGATGLGVIEAAKELGKWAIGADTDQNYLAPDNVLTSAMKDVGAGIYNVCKSINDGENLGGTVYTGTLANGAVGYAPSTSTHVPADVIADTDALMDKMIAGDVVAPINEEEFNAFVAAL